MKRKILILFLVIFILGFMRVSPVLFQEGNPIPVVKGIVELSLNDNDIVQVSNDSKKYLTKTSVGNAPIIELMNKEGWEFQEQLGAGYIFIKDGDRIIIESVQYTGKYKVWTLPE